jgi:DNA-binding transcriptional ArsR family regulator
VGAPLPHEAIFLDVEEGAVLEALREGEKSVGSLAEELGLEQPSVSQQLSILRQRGFVEPRTGKV